MERFTRDGRRPDLRRVLQSQRISPDDEASYAVAVSLTEYLLSRSSPTDVVRFAAAAKRDGWEIALEQHYALKSLEDLELAWQAWARLVARTTIESRAQGGGR